MRHDIDICVSPSGAVVDGDPIEEVVVKLNAMYKAATLDFTLAVGTLIIDTFYSGDLSAWRARGSKDCSFRKLARHPRLPMSPTALYRSVAIHELCERLGVREWKTISSTHLRSVLKLPPDQQRALLTTAEASGWSVRRLDDEVARLDLERSSRGGRRRVSRLKKTIATLEKNLAAAASLLSSSNGVPEVTPQNALSVVEALARMKEICASLEERIRCSLADAKTTLSVDGVSSPSHERR